MATTFKKINYKTGTTPLGVAVFPHLNKADDKFNKVVFKVNLQVDPEAAQPIADNVEALLVQLEKADPAVLCLLKEKDADKLKIAVKQKKVKRADPAVLPETDKEGNETGKTILKLKKNGTYKDKEGNDVQTKLPLFNAKRTPTTVNVWGGSEIKVSFKYMPWINAKNEIGVKLGMEAVQVLVARSGGNKDASEYGFGEEEGYEAPAAGEDAGTPEDRSGGGDDF
jgi:hypothetical protein